MHVCIFGTGVAGWMVAHSLKNLEKVTKITIIGSDKIPTIGVGESTTLSFYDWVISDLGIEKKNFFNFINNINATIKYGVSYEGWSSEKFLHGFWMQTDFAIKNQYLLANKPVLDNVNIYNSFIASYAYKNKISLNVEDHPLSLQFEANSLIQELQFLATKENKITHKIGTLKSIEYEKDNNEKIKKTILDNDEEIYADYYVNSIGSTSFNQKIFKEEYEWYDNILLTNKAIFAPIEYKNKKEEIHPYTIAKAMKYGWRWITPTWNRIGTGYVFSDRYCSIDEAKKELAKDIGKDLDFQVVDFTPRKVKKTFKENYCTIGMAAGFLEPLDAPGLTITILTIHKLKEVLQVVNNINYKNILDDSNNWFNFLFNFWASFIFLQYKTSQRNDTEFWKDFKKVQFDSFENFYKELPNDTRSNWERTMFFSTMAGKNINWTIETDELPVKLDISNIKTIDHLNFLNLIKNNKNLLDKVDELDKFYVKARHKKL